ncbi:MAG TPA: hypothetical protein DHM90_06150, partial [Clostridiaceae bacterium]|nr:hypothetical protein [Clostridiaceae bacterium]
KIEFLDETDETKADIDVDVRGEEMTIDFFGEIRSSRYPDRDLNVMRRALFILLEEKTGKHLPWGILIGIRPSKIVRELIEEGRNCDEIVQELQ